MRGLLLVLLLLAAGQAVAAERILALTPHICEILFAVGAGDEVVGAGEYCNEPQAAADLPRVANFSQVYTEAALRLKPTLALALDEALPGLDVLRRAGVRTAASDPQSVAEVLADIRRLGELAGHGRQADELAASLAHQLEAMKAEKSPELSVYYELWDQPLLAVGGTGFLQDVLRLSGVKNVFAGVPRESVRVSRESVIRAHPDLIIVSGNDESVARRRVFWAHWLPQASVMPVDADLMSRPGPRIVRAVASLRRQVRGLEAR